MAAEAPHSSDLYVYEGISYDLRDSEVAWRDRQNMLEQHGYLLRPRFRPGWIPSWVNTSKRPLLCEDALYNPVGIFQKNPRLEVID